MILSGILIRAIQSFCTVVVLIGERDMIYSLRLSAYHLLLGGNAGSLAEDRSREKTCRLGPKSLVT
jgi:hypothetical protein